MSKIGFLSVIDGGHRVGFYCPGCKTHHQVTVKDDIHPNWGWNGSYDKPTFTPSILVRGTHLPTDEEYAILMSGGTIEPRKYVCHSFVTDGKIQFLSDCTHELAGQTVDLASA